MTSPKNMVRDLALILLTLTQLYVMSSGECQKIHQQREIQMPGYKTIPIHTNACKETTAAYIEPAVDLEVELGIVYIKKYHDGCCCAVRNSSEHRVSIESVDGRTIRSITYRRIDSCTCTQCNFDAAIARHTIIDYMD